MVKFVITSILLGVGLAMDAFSVSLANGLNEPKMKFGRMMEFAGTFGAFQFFMPLIGWFCVHTIVEYFTAFQPFIPWIALILLGYIGGKMIWEGFHGDEDEEAEKVGPGWKGLMVLGVATSIDALSVGFTISEYTFIEAFGSSLIIGITTLIICLAGLELGKRFGMKFAGKATIFGGIILVLIGLEIFISNVF
jgi:putative Mn2+ efflux pump MntP